MILSNLSETEIDFEMWFKHPQLVSRGRSMDKMLVYFNLPEAFISTKTLKTLDFPTQQSRWKSKSIPA